jgi:2-amino-4-hydroxy-6-hydroxymethyldihydropteridine diphosphokinase
LKNSVYISIGSNIGDKIENISTVINEIKKTIGEVNLTSSNYKSDPWGFNSNETFINAVICIQTKYNPTELIKELQIIEKKMGRTRSHNKGYTDRIIDLDIIYFNDEIVNTIELKIPHTNLYFRKFVLIPLNEIAPNYIDPLKKTTIKELLEICPDESILEKVINNN